VKQDKTEALEMFNKGEGGFKDRDLYVFCADASTGVETAHPTPREVRFWHLADVETVFENVCFRAQSGH
jgi:hypothetical protein